MDRNRQCIAGTNPALAPTRVSTRVLGGRSRIRTHCFPVYTVCWLAEGMADESFSVVGPVGGEDGAEFACILWSAKFGVRIISDNSRWSPGPSQAGTE